MGPSREACDRCHQMKSRCVREPGLEICLRCSRLGKICNYSPPGQPGRPAKHRKTSLSAGSRRQLGKTPEAALSESQDMTCVEPLSSLDDRFSCMAATEDNNDTEVFLDHFDFNHSPSSFDSGFENIPSPLMPGQTPLSTTDTREEADRGRTQGIPRKAVAIERLIGLKASLIHLRGDFTTGKITSKSVEGLYHSHGELVSILKGYDDLQSSHHTRTTSHSSSALPNIVWLLLLSACYYSLLQSFELLEDVLHKELTRDSEEGYGGSSGSSLVAAQLPSFSVNVGSVAITVPQKEGLEMNLRLLSTMVKLLRKTMAECFSHMDSFQNSSMDKRSSNDASFQRAISELRKNEERLFDKLRRKGFT